MTSFRFEKIPAPAESMVRMKSDASHEHEAALERRARTLLVCPDNDAEAHMILLLAEKMGMTTLRSQQMHGARLEREKDLVHLLAASRKHEVWIVEMPGENVEKALRESGVDVHIIDHHTYGPVDRVTDPVTKQRKPSSLEQFLSHAAITDEELERWGYDPKTVRGLGIFDDRFVQGLRDEGYTKPEINAVLDLNGKFSRAINPVFDQIGVEARKAWEARQEWRGYTIVQSDYVRDIRGAIGHITIREDQDTKPLIVSSNGGKKLFVHHVSPETIAHLQQELPQTNTFTFGSGRCWGYDSAGETPRITLEQVKEVLGKVDKNFVEAA